jgi:fumarylacetoacetate (FAA) hydrolase
MATPDLELPERSAEMKDGMNEACDPRQRNPRRPARCRLARPDALHRRDRDRPDAAGRPRRLEARRPEAGGCWPKACPTTRSRRSAFHEHDALSPLPRAYQWADGSAYVNHVELVRKARNAELPETFWTDPLMYQGGSDAFLAPRAPIVMADEAWGIDMEGEIAVIVDDVPMGATPDQARDAIRLVMLVNDVSLRGLIPGELAKGFGFFQSKPSSAFSPVAVTPDDLGDAWDGGKLALPLRVDLNGKPLGRANAGDDMTFDFPAIIAHAAKTRPLRAGAIVGSGTVSNKDADGGPGRPVADGGLGYSCLAELRTVETILDGAPKTPFMHFGDTVRIEMMDAEGHSIFGAIEQTIEKYEGAA